MIAYPSNDQANLALVEGEIDWAGNFVPAIERTFVARDRAHHGYWYPPTGSTVFVYPNTQRAPLDDVRVRKALSLAIDRRRVVDIGLYG
jgi:peptide/nickel transport system substrate-binding protein